MDFEYLIISSAFIHKKGNKPFLWGGLHSLAFHDGNIVQFIHNYLKKKNTKDVFLLIQTDGNITHDNVEEIKKGEDIKENIIVGTLAQQTIKCIKFPPNLVYLPSDDNIFNIGIYPFFNSIMKESMDYFVWENKLPIAFWRGGCSGLGDENNIRYRTVKKLENYPNTDVKFVETHTKHDFIKDTLYTTYCDLSEFFKYKMLLVIDGNTNASNHMWTFCTGCVPLFVSTSIVWFSDYLVPYENYIPISFDLYDLHEKIKWVLLNDDKAKKIAENALELSKTIFSAEKQQQHLEKQLDKFMTY